MASPLALTSLREGPLTLSVLSSEQSWTPGREFAVPCTVRNVSDTDLALQGAGSVLHVAYRWYSENGECLDSEGRRTKVPSPIAAAASQKVVVAGLLPDRAGRYRLLISLVLEGVHWACDVSDQGWAAIDVTLTAPPVWPDELRNSSAGKAMRGALARLELQDNLRSKGFDLAGVTEPGQEPAPVLQPASLPMEPVVDEVTEPVDVSTSVAARRTWSMRLRAWVRHYLGLPEMRFAVEELLTRSTDQRRELDEVHTKLADANAKVEVVSHQLLETRASLSGALRRVESSEESLSLALHDLPAQFERAVAASAGKSTEELQQSLSGLSGRLRSDLDEMTTQAVTSVTNGAAANELITGMRNLLMLLEGIGQELTPSLSQLETRSIQHSTTLDALYDSSGLQTAKLDHLLLRESIPVPGAGLVFQRNRLGLIAIQDDDPAAIAYYASGAIPEPGTVAIVERLLRPGDIFLDVGANVGAFTLLAARLVGAGGKVIAVEPMPETARMLRTTVAVNGVTPIVEVSECALGEQDGSATIFAGVTSGHSSLRPLNRGQGEKTFEIEVRAGAELLGNRAATLIKIDVEGFELQVLNGLREYLEGHPDTAVVLEYSPAHVAAAGRTVSGWLDEIRALRPKIWVIEDEPASLRPLGRGRPPAGGANLLCCHQLPTVLGDMLKGARGR